MLASRSGPAAPGAAALAAALAAAGTAVTVTACDLADPAAARALVTAAAARGPVTAVVHAAGVLHDATLAGLDPARLEAVLRAKAAAAWNLHQAAAGQPLAAFVLYSSAAGILGPAGQGAYAAANAALDALAAWRRAAGQPAVSLAWGLWQDPSGMTGHLTGADRARIARAGLVPMPAPRALALLDTALATGAGYLVPAALHLPALRAAAAAGTPLPAPLRALAAAAPGGAPAAAGTPGPGAAGAGGRLAALPPARRRGALEHLVAAHAAAVLGHPGPASVAPDQPFQDAGFDSLTAVELRNRLAAATGLPLPATLAFDYPTPRALAAYLHTALSPAPAAVPAPAVPARAGTGEPVAIVGMGCRFPGGADSPGLLWDLVAAGRDAVSAFPADRGWDTASLYHPDPDHPGTSYARHGGFLGDPAGFDAGFFGISPREALAADPQQRLLLEVAWQALESAGIDPAALRGTPAGVYAGLMHSDYAAAPRRAGAGRRRGTC